MLKIKRVPPILFLTGLILFAALNTATVRKRTSPILKTQTDPIKLKDKLEEVKDGEKGPATPVFGWYGGNKFLIDPPLDKKKDEKPAPEPANKVSEVSVEEQKPEENAPENSGQGPEENSAPAAKEPESLPPKADTVQDAARPQEQNAGGHKPQDGASKGEKDWWDEI